MKLRIYELMTRDVAQVPPEARFAHVVSMMIERRISCVLVCEKQVPLGVISERDIVRSIERKLDGEDWPATAGDVMSGPPITVEARWGVERAMEVIQERRIRRLPVVESNGELVGLITQTDLLGAQGEMLVRTVEDRTRELQQANAQLRALSNQDGLLGIGNRRAMDEALQHADRVAERYGRPYAVVLFDVDHFKAYNDHYGHPAADVVLKDLAQVLSDNARDADAVFRYGGEEILILLTETDLAGARVLAERAREAVFTRNVPSEPTPLGRVTVSCGIAASHDPPDETPHGWQDVLARADASLYEAKRAGRNCVGGPVDA